MIRPAHIPASIVETETTRISREAAQYSLDLRFPVHLIGRPGTGKSSALWHISQEMGGSYCEISGPSKTMKGMFESLLRSLGRRIDSKYLADIADEVYRAFEPRQQYVEDIGGWRFLPRLLVVDEVQTLEATAFRELLRVQEKCSLGLVLAGNEERLAGDKRDAATWAQIESRIAMQRHLPGPGTRDCELIGATYNVEGRDAYAVLSSYGVATNFRDLVQLLETAKRLTGGTAGIRREHLEGSLRLLKPRPEILKLLKSEAA
ncbi:MAG: AAA family ATPase [Allorhizobium sp.]